MKFTYENTPGYYNVPSDTKTSQYNVISIPKQHKSKKKVENIKPVPGPGSYNIIKKHNDSVKIGMSFHRPNTALNKEILKYPSPTSYFSSISYKSQGSKITYIYAYYLILNIKLK